MRHPYGIWNISILLGGQVLLYYETSLWDLKLRILIELFGLKILWDIPMGFETQFIVISLKIGSIMRHPYGIWNLQCWNILFLVLLLWDIPMGFETTHETRQLNLFHWLWDIPMGFETFFFLLFILMLIIMRHPYGIWNLLLSAKQNKRSKLWDIPMGFETQR